MAAPRDVPVLILGAGAAGLFCAGHLPPGTLVIDHARRPAEKVRISGGGRCNFTNLDTRPGAFLSANPHFAKAALAGYTAAEFVALVEAHRIPWHVKTLGQAFCDRTSADIVDLLTGLAARAGAEVRLSTTVVEVTHDGNRFRATLEREGHREEVTSPTLVLATGGKSIPKMGATDLSLRLARQFGLRLTDTRPALVPLTFPDGRFADLAGVAAPATVSAARGPGFTEAVLCTHRGLSGPAILQASSYWREGEAVRLAWAPGTDWAALMAAAGPKTSLATALGRTLPARLAARLAAEIGDGPLGRLSQRARDEVVRRLGAWELKPTGSEGWRTAEVMLGGIDTRDLDGRTMAARGVPGLHAIGECVDVTGWLGGYNFQWAWASAMACARGLRASARG